jgi:polar amino acid transport system substrate-binding protein
MNRIQKIVLPFFAATFLTSLSSAQTITLRADAWCPMNCKPNSNREGYMIDIAKEVFGKAGMKVDYQELNWSRTLQEVKEGKIDGAVGASADDAKELVLHAEPLGNSQSCFYGKESETWTLTDVKSLEGKSLAVVKDYAYGEPLDGYIKANTGNAKRVDVLAGDEPLARNAKKVVAGRVDLLVETKYVADDYIKTSGEKLKNVGCLPEKQALYIGFSPKNPNSAKYAKVLSDGIVELRKSGKLKEILSKYGLADWK